MSAGKCCLDCGSGPMVSVQNRKLGQVRSAGRGLCGPCYMIRWKSGTLIDRSRQSRTLEDFLDDWRALHQRGGNVSQVAAAIGMDVSAVRRRLRQAREAGHYVPEVLDDYARIRSQANRKLAQAAAASTAEEAER